MKRSDFAEVPGVPPEQEEMAKKLAYQYRAHCKANHIFGNPFHPKVPVELQSVFQHFLKAAEIVLEFEATPADYIAAQFVGLHFLKKFRKRGGTPYPSQLHTGNARVRYMDYMAGRKLTAERKVTSSDYMVEVGSFDVEERKATRYAERLGVSKRRAVRSAPKEFSKEYLKHLGLWETVRTEFLT